MRERFEGALRAFSEDIKKLEELDKKDKTNENGAVNLELEILSEKIDGHLKKAADIQHTGKDLEVQKEIFDIQKKKQGIMKRLEDQISCLYNPECVMQKMEGDRDAVFDEKSGYFKYTDSKGNRGRSATFGEIMTDIDWGVTYSLDKITTPPRILKKYLVERARKELQNLLDLQIIKSETNRMELQGTFVQEAYLNVESGRESGESKEMGGFISETMVKNFLKKLSIDSNLPFTIKDADVFQDVNQKIDFIIHIKERARGVGVLASEKAEYIGVQFTINADAEAHKREQINRSVNQLRNRNDIVQDIALVVFPLRIARKLKSDWEYGGKPSGGPDRNLDIKTAEELFGKLLEDIFEPDEISKYWDKVKRNFYTTSNAA